jgi:hypothetical protein
LGRRPQILRTDTITSLEVLISRIVTPFGAHSTATEIVAGISLAGKRMIVTGASAGIGVETARALARTGASVTLAVRDAHAGARVAADITSTTGNDGVHVARLTAGDLAAPGGRRGTLLG